MSCEDLEPLVTMTYSYGKMHATKHRRDCGTVKRTINAPSAGSQCAMNESEYKRLRHNFAIRAMGGTNQYPIPSDHVCMKRWNEHGKAAINATLDRMGEPALA